MKYIKQLLLSLALMLGAGQALASSNMGAGSHGAYENLVGQLDELEAQEEERRARVRVEGLDCNVNEIMDHVEEVAGQLARIQAQAGEIMAQADERADQGADDSNNNETPPHSPRSSFWLGYLTDSAKKALNSIKDTVSHIGSSEDFFDSLHGGLVSDDESGTDDGSNEDGSGVSVIPAPGAANDDESEPDLVDFFELFNNNPVQAPVLINPVVPQQNVNVNIPNNENIPNNQQQRVPVGVQHFAQPDPKTDNKPSFGIAHAIAGCVVVGLGYWLFQKYFKNTDLKEEARTTINK